MFFYVSGTSCLDTLDPCATANPLLVHDAQLRVCSYSLEDIATAASQPHHLNRFAENHPDSCLYHIARSLRHFANRAAWKSSQSNLLAPYARKFFVLVHGEGARDRIFPVHSGRQVPWWLRASRPYILTDIVEDEQMLAASINLLSDHLGWIFLHHIVGLQL